MPQMKSLQIKKSDLQHDGMTSHEIDGHTIVVCKIGDEFYAFPDTCSHEEWPLSEGYFTDERMICSLHGAAFDPRTGACQRGPATNALIPYTVHEQDDLLFIDLEDGQ